MTWASFDPVNIGPLAFLGLALFGLALRRSGIAMGVVSGFAFGLALFLPLVHWATISTGAILPWIALSVSQAAFLAVAGGLTSVVRRAYLPGPLWALCAAFIYTAVEHIRCTWPWDGFPWARIAYTQVDTPVVRTAPYISAIGVTLITVFLAYILTEALAYLSQLDLVAGAGLILGVIGVVTVFLTIPLSSGGTDHIRIGWVQSGSGDDVNGSRALGVTSRLAEETRSLDHAEVVVWPESASDRDARIDPEAHEIVSGISRELGVPLLMGTQEYVDDGRYNDYLVWSDGEVVDRYSKTVPVAFGEYIPHRDFFSSLTSTTDLISVDMLAGEGSAILNVPLDGDRKLAAPICFEIASNHVTRQAMVDGGEAFIVPVNTASFGNSAESLQQLRQTIFRSVEYSRASIQVSTAGVSAVVQPNGSVTELSDMWETTSGVTRLPLRTDLTWSARWGAYYEYAVLAAAAISVTGGILRRTRTS